MNRIREKIIICKAILPAILLIPKTESLCDTNSEERNMKSNSALKRLNFKDEILPDFEALLQFSLWLIKMGRQSAVLMREAMAEACRSCHDSVPEECCKQWLEEIVPKSLFGGLRHRAHSLIPIAHGNVDTSLEKYNRLISGRKASLPAACQFAIILSYLEGFSEEEIANLVSAQPHAIESLLNRSREMLREEYFEFLRDNGRTCTGSDQAKASR